MNLLTVIAAPVIIMNPSVNGYFVWAARVVPTCRVAAEAKSDEIRIKGGLLEVSNIHANDRFERNSDVTILNFAIGKVVTKIRVSVTYRHHGKLAEDWKALL